MLTVTSALHQSKATVVVTVGLAGLVMWPTLAIRNTKGQRKGKTMEWYTFNYKGTKIEIGANCWQAAMQMVSDNVDLANGYWQEHTYEERTFTYKTKERQ